MVYNHGLEKACPLCGSKNIVLLNTIEPNQLFNRLPKNNKIDKSVFSLYLFKLWRNKEAYFLKCLNCYISFADPFIAGDDSFYNMLYVDENVYPKWKWDFQLSYEFIKRKKKEGFLDEVKLLEIGAGNGTFLRKIIEDVVNKENVLATEYSMYGRETLNNMGIQCINYNITNLIDNNKIKLCFDVICMFQILEHLDQLDSTFSKLVSLIRSGGFIIIAVPNNRHRELFERFNFIEDLPPVHITRWSKESFNYVSSKYKLKIVDHRIEPTNILHNISKYVSYCNSGRLYQNVITLKYRPIRVLFRIFASLIFILTHIPQIFLLCKKKMGVSQWICFEKL